MEVIVVPFGVATLTKLAGRELGMVPGRHTTGQLTPTTGEAGLGLRARLETSNVPFMSHKKTSASLCCTVSLAVLFLHSPLTAPCKAASEVGCGVKGGGRTAPLQTESKLFMMKAEGDAKEEEPFFFPGLSSLVAQEVKDVCGGASLPHQWSGGVRLVL